MATRKAKHIRDRLTEALAKDAPPRVLRELWFLKLIAEMLLFLEQRSEENATAVLRKLAHIERRIEQMAVDTSKFAADLVQMAADLDEIKTGVATLIANAASNGEAAAQAEADQLTGQLDTAAAALREAASQFDPAAAAAAKRGKH